MSGVNQFRLSNDGIALHDVQLHVVGFGADDGRVQPRRRATGGSSTNGVQTVYAQVHDNTGNWGPTFTDTITLQNRWRSAAAATSAAPSSYSQAIANDNPASYWRLDESSGTNAADSAGSNPGVVQGIADPRRGEPADQRRRQGGDVLRLESECRRRLVGIVVAGVDGFARGVDQTDVDTRLAARSRRS